MFKRVLITGGFGFLGQYVMKDILNEFPDVEIKILDKNPNPKSLLNSNYISKVTVSIKDICDYDSIENEFNNIDLVINLIGLVSSSLKDKKLLERVNFQGTKNILKAIAINKVKKLIHISSVAALGYCDDKNKTIDESFIFDWNIAKKRKKYYMFTKHLADLEIEKCINKDLDAVILHPSLMFGPGDLTNSFRIIRSIKDGRIPFNTPGGISVINVRDVSRGILTLLKKDISKGKYLLSGYNLTFKEINKIISNELSVKCPKFTLPRILRPLLFNLFLFIESVSKNKLELTADDIDNAFKFRHYDNTKAKKELGWEPEITFEQTIKDTIKWMVENGFI